MKFLLKWSTAATLVLFLLTVVFSSYEDRSLKSMLLLLVAIFVLSFLTIVFLTLIYGQIQLFLGEDKWGRVIIAAISVVVTVIGVSRAIAHFRK